MSVEGDDSPFEDIDDGNSVARPGSSLSGNEVCVPNRSRKLTTEYHLWIRRSLLNLYELIVYSVVYRLMS